MLASARPARLVVTVALLAMLGACAGPATLPGAGPGASAPGVGPSGAAAGAARGFDGAAVEAAVRAVLEAQVAAWNEGSIRGFMDGYARTDSLTFLSGGTVRLGWEQSTYAYIRAYPSREAMGTLAFTDVHVRPLSAERALVWGRWRLTAGGGRPPSSGLFTLLFERLPEGWRIVHDHTSSAS